MLRVLDPPAARRGRRMSGKCRLVKIEHFAVGPIADRMDAELHVVRRRRFRPSLAPNRATPFATQRLAGMSEYGSSSHAPCDPSAPSSVFLIARTVKKPSPCADDASLRQLLSESGIVVANHDPQAQAQLASLGQFAKPSDDRQRRTGVLKRRDAIFQALFRRQVDRTIDDCQPCCEPSLRGRARRALGPFRAARRWLRPDVATICAAGRVRRLCRDASQLHRQSHWQSPCARWRASASTGCRGVASLSERWTGSPSTFGYGG